MGSDSSHSNHDLPLNNKLLAIGVTAAMLLCITCANLLSPDPLPSGKKTQKKNRVSLPKVILHNAKLVTSKKTLEETALVIGVDGRILALTDEKGLKPWKKPGVEVVDLQGQVVIPGLRDAHGHIVGLAKHKVGLDLSEADDRYDLCSRVESHLVTYKGKWLVARGWDRSKWTDKSGDISLSFLDTYTGDTPTVLKRVDGHAAWVNSAAMKIAGITNLTPDPEGGKIVKDSYNQATGMLIDSAMDLVTKHIPKITDEELEEHWRRGLNAAAKVGLVAVHDAGMGAQSLRVLEALAKKETLPVRVYVMLSPGNKDFYLKQLKKGPRVGLYNDQVTIRAVKIFQDGALGSHGAALFEDYKDKPGFKGILSQSPYESFKISKLAIDAGFQVCTHAIGDRAIRLVLDNYGELFRQPDYAGVKAARMRLEHAQVISPKDLPRFAEMGVIASMQPTHATSDQSFAEDRVGATRLKGAYAWKTLLKSGAPLAFGSDFPVEEESPLRGIYAAVSRQNSKGHPKGGWRMSEALTPGQALEAFTSGPAFAAFEEQERGELKVGHKADLTILAENPMTVARKQASKLTEIKIIGTYVNGKKVTLLKMAGE
ncbi:MAG: amidohydrolase family protein [Planctomycetota bacterium]|nr:amidohydrolase family protein [Planctomycetota bacterium]